MQQNAFIIVAIVSDMGGGNRKLNNELEVDFKKPWYFCTYTDLQDCNSCTSFFFFRFLYEDRKIFVFNDAPHLIKLIRNHFLDSGFIIENKEIKKDIIVNLLSLQTNDLKITPNISLDNLCVVGPERQKVKLATKLFSNTVAQSITRAASLGFLRDQNWSDCHEFFKLVITYTYIFCICIQINFYVFTLTDK